MAIRIAALLMFVVGAALLGTTAESGEGKAGTKSKPGQTNGDKKTEGDGKGDKKPITKVTAAGIEFELLASRINGQHWELSIGITSPNADSTVRVNAASGYSEDGKVYTAKFTALSKKAINPKLPVGQKVVVTFNVAPLPENVTKMSTVELQCISKGKGGSYTVTFKNIAVAR